MRAQVLDRPRPVEERPLALRVLSDPAPGPGEVLVRVSACGVCRTDLHTVEGELDLPVMPVIPGHQVVGTVAGLGAGVAAEILGKRVGIAWVWGTCGVCAFCLSGKENLCLQARFTGVHEQGGYAELLRLAAEVPIHTSVEELPLADR